MSEVVWLWFPSLRNFRSLKRRLNWVSDRPCSSPSATLVRLALELDREGTSAYCQLQWLMGQWSCDDYIPPHGESSVSIGIRILGMSELMSKLKGVSVVSVEHRGVGVSSAFPTLGWAGISAFPFMFSLKTLRSMTDADTKAHL